MFIIITQDEIDEAMLEACFEYDYELHFRHFDRESYMWACKLLRRINKTENEQKSSIEEG